MNSETSQFVNATNSKVVVAQNVRHQGTRKSRISANQKNGDPRKPISEQVLTTITQLSDEKLVRNRFVKELGNLPGAIGACYLVKGPDDFWRPERRLPSLGRIPNSSSFSAECSENCDDFLRSPNAQQMPIASVGGLTGLFVPIRPRNSEPELILIIIRKNVDAIQAIGPAQQVGSALQLWLNGRDSADSHWQVETLASINELLSITQGQPNHQSACEEIVNQLANRLDCESVALGIFQKGRLRLTSLSGVPKFKKGSETSQAYTQALIESCTRREPGLFPTQDPDADFLLQSHKQLASLTQSEAVYSQPLIVQPADKMIGSLVFTGPKKTLRQSQFERYAAAVAPGAASSLELMKVLTPGPIGKTIGFFKKISPAKKTVALLALVLAVLAMLLPISYRVRCNCTVEPTSRRFAVAPFDGQIIKGHAEPGDVVAAGDVLAEMDGRTIRWELSGVVAKRNQSKRSREMELAERNVPAALMAELDYDRLIAEQNVLEFKKDNLLIKSPVDGVVLSGSLERAEAASVEIGKTLFEIGPLSPLRIEIAIPSEDIPHVQVGFPVKVWIDGQEDEPVEGEILKIHPMSEVRDADNIFVAEIEFPNEDSRLRPGMKGVARIDGEKKSLGWCLFHKPVNWMKSRLTWF